MNPVFCRMCLKDPPADSLVFSIYDTFQGRPLVELIDELFSIKVIVEDRLLNVCVECVTKIHSVQKIHRLFVANNDKLQNMLQSEEAEEIGIDNETDNVGYEVIHTEETSTESRSQEPWVNGLAKDAAQTPHRRTNGGGGGETEAELLSVEERNTQEMEELYLDSDVKCEITRHVGEVGDELSTDERVGKVMVLSELNRKCYFCGVLFSTSLEFINHLTQHIHQVPYTCTECNGLVLHSVQQASKHIGMHNRTDRPYGCRICSLRFLSKDRSLCHERKMHRYKLKKQIEKQKQQLNRALSSRSASMLDALTSIRQPNPKPFNCQLCGRSFTLKRNLNRHMKLHSGEEKRHKCPECDRAFRQSSELNIHLRRHRLNEARECLQKLEKNIDTSKARKDPID